MRTPLFTMPGKLHWHRMVALVSLTVSAAVVYTEARCSNCGRHVMAVPGVVALEVRSVQSNRHRSGRGAAVSCQRCGTLLEIIEHGRRGRVPLPLS